MSKGVPIQVMCACGQQVEVVLDAGEAFGDFGDTVDAYREQEIIARRNKAHQAVCNAKLNQACDEAVADNAK